MSAEVPDDTTSVDVAPEKSRDGRASVASNHPASETSQGSTKSLSPSLISFYFEYGRRYCSETYHLPNDSAEETRLAIAHQAYLLLLDGQLTTARIPRNVKSILDIGTGSGDWAIAMGARYPSAEIIATDISFYEATDVPPNVFFQVDNAEEEWTYSDPFDFIHTRGLKGAWGDWGKFYREAYSHLRPGGFIEVVDSGFTQMPEMQGSALEQFNGVVKEASRKAGISLGLEHLKRSVVSAAGFVNIISVTMDVPLGTWDSDPRKKVMGKMALIAELEGLEATSLRLLTKHMGWKAEDVRELCERVKIELLKPDAHAFTPCHFLVARRLL